MKKIGIKKANPHFYKKSRTTPDPLLSQIKIKEDPTLPTTDEWSDMFNNISRSSPMAKAKSKKKPTKKLVKKTAKKAVKKMAAPTCGCGCDSCG